MIISFCWWSFWRLLITHLSTLEISSPSLRRLKFFSQASYVLNVDKLTELIKYQDIMSLDMRIRVLCRVSGK